MLRLNSSTDSKIDSAIGLLANVPQYIFNKLLQNKNSGEKVEFTILYRTDTETIKKTVEELGGEFEDLEFNFGIVKITLDKIDELAVSPYVQYIELPKSLYASDLKSSRASCVPQTISTYNVSGKGVLIGFIDSGIDYTHPAFLDRNGNTRIEYIYDLSAGGKVYDKDKINEAIKSNNPYSIVPENDITGHGTHVAGCACGGGNIPLEYKGIAQEASIIMVKGAVGRWVLSSDIMKGIKFLIDKSKELNMPLVINISLSTNDGAHNGTSLLEQYIDITSNLERVTIVIAAGNEGDAAHHASGILKGIQSKSLNIATDEEQVIINLYKPILPTISINLVSSTGERSGDINIREGYFQGNIGRDRFDIYVSGPKPFELNSEIQIILTPISNKYLSDGQWTIEIETLNEYSGQFSIWLPISEGLNPATKFLNPDIFNTIGIPATVDNIIAVGSYNSTTDTISTFSGKGNNYADQIIRPDIVAPGENVVGPAPNNSYDSKTGTSMATPQVSGICALFSEWGVVKGNDPYLYGQRLKYYLVMGANRKRTDVQYPNPLWGYGSICAFDSMKILENSINLILAGRNHRQLLTNIRESNSLNNKKDMSYIKAANIEDLLDNIERFATDKNEMLGLIVEFSKESQIDSINKIPRTIAIPLSQVFAIVLIPISEIKNLIPYVNNIIPVYNPQLFTLSAISPVEASGAPFFNDNIYLNLDGTDVVVGILDTGIDYLNEEFMLEDDTTRIVRIFDQTIVPEGTASGEQLLGTEYTEEQINQAIQLSKQGGDPYTIVPSKDENGHGTMTAGIIGARGRNPDLKGAAPNCKFAIVKLKEASKFLLNFGGVPVTSKNVYGDIDILLAITYIYRLAKKLNRPFVLYLPLGTNVGGHDGTSAVEAIFDIQSIRIGFIPVVGTGNQGDKQTHTEGKMERNGDIQNIQIKVGKNQKNLNFQIYFQKPDKVEIEIISPSGEFLEKIDVKIKRVSDYKFVYEGTYVTVIYLYPDSLSGDEVAIIRFKDIREGIWNIRLYGVKIVDGRYYAWLPQRELLDPETRFLNPVQDITLTIPSTSRSVISAAYYDQNKTSIVSASGKGYPRNGQIKPDIAAGGVNATVIGPGGQTTLATGSSVASAVVAGCCALLLQWAVIDGNEPDVELPKIQRYIIAGAKTRAGDIYPNKNWGYGMIDMQTIINSLRSNKEKYNYIKFDELIKTWRGLEYVEGNLFYRFP